MVESPCRNEWTGLWWFVKTGLKQPNYSSWRQEPWLTWSLVSTKQFKTAFRCCLILLIDWRPLFLWIVSVNSDSISCRRFKSSTFEEMNGVSQGISSPYFLFQWRRLRIHTGFNSNKRFCLLAKFCTPMSSSGFKPDLIALLLMLETASVFVVASSKTSSENYVLLRCYRNTVLSLFELDWASDDITFIL